MYMEDFIEGLLEAQSICKTLMEDASGDERLGMSEVYYEIGRLIEGLKNFD